jgi:excisionase family DNA binding protein
MAVATKKTEKEHLQIRVPGFYTCEQAAEELDLQPDSVRRYIHRGLIRAGLVGDVYLISQKQLDDFRNSRRGVGNPAFRRENGRTAKS